MAHLDDVRRVAELEHLAVLAIARPDRTVQASVVSAGVLDDPIDATPCVGLVAMGDSRKLQLLRTHPQATVTFRHAADWAAVAGRVRLIGPDDLAAVGVDVAAVVRAVFVAAGGTHDDWATFDRLMAEERRCAVLVRADRLSANG